MPERIQSLREFWPYYLSEHSNPRSRALHFVGTTGFMASCVASAVTSPIAFPAAVAGMLAIGKKGVELEKKQRPFKHVLGMLALPTLASPVLFPAGVVFAYGCAWAGHFGFEKNRPATFQYPLMSLASDFKMWSHMARGKLWSGDPLVELGFVPEPGGPHVEGQPAVAAAE